MIKLFQTYGSPIWPGTLPTSKPFTNNATWDESTGINVSTVFTVPNTITYRDNSFEFSNKFVQSAFRPGALPTTSLLERRPITIEGEVFMDTRADLEELERQFKRAAIRPHLKLGLDDEKYINLSALKDFSWIYRQKSGRTFAFVKVTWEAGDPFWYRWERPSSRPTRPTLGTSITGSPSPWMRTLRRGQSTPGSVLWPQEVPSRLIGR